MNLKNKIILILVGFLILVSSNSYAQTYKNIPAAIHVQTDISDGMLSFDQIAKFAREKNIKVVVFTDSFLRRWEYGLPPLENIIKRRIEQNSVLRFGIKNYLNAIKTAQKNNPDVLLIPGVEVVPFYYWKGNFWNKNFTLYNWHKQLMVIGLNSEKDYRFLPVIANYSILPLRRENLARIWPLLVIAMGITALVFSRGRRAYKQWGIVLLAFGLIFLINNLYFSISRFNAYSRDQFIKPYQDLFDYANKKNGLVFWLHPEVENFDRVIGVNVRTYSYKDDLLYTYNYTGTSVLFDDNRSIARIGDIWDKTLLAYCAGKRSPVWAIGVIDFYGGDDQDISNVQTILLLKDLNQKEALNALRTGKMYAKLNDRPNDFSLDNFSVTDLNKETEGFMGDDIKLNTAPEIDIETSSSVLPDEPIEISLIRNGSLIETFNSEGANFSVRHQDDYYNENEKVFYRVMIKSKRNLFRIISNPIFVEFASK